MAEPPPRANDMLLEVRNLRAHFRTDAGVARAVDGVNFNLKRGECVALAGESGCGKSVTSLALMRLLAMPPAFVPAGVIVFDGRDLLRLSEAEMCGVRGREIAMIFQEPQTALNPVFTAGQQIAEAYLAHHPRTRAKEARERALFALRAVGIPDPERRMSDYPHQLSGGMKQRVCIAMALICNPKLLIADEPTTALDVTIQAQILELLKKLQAERHLSLLLITHDLGIVAEMAARTYVMYAGKIVEECATAEIFKRPLHPYTQGLLRARPDPGSSRRRLAMIPGIVPAATQFKDNCRFNPRCPLCTNLCVHREPLLSDYNLARAKAEIEALNEELSKEPSRILKQFGALAQLSDVDIQAILREVDINDLAPALAGAPPSFAEAVYRNLSKRAGKRLKEEIDLLNPNRLNEIEPAQKRVWDLCRRLKIEEKIGQARAGEITRRESPDTTDWGSEHKAACWYTKAEGIDAWSEKLQEEDPNILQFRDLAHLSDVAMQAVLREMDINDLALALIDAPLSVVRVVHRNLSTRAAERMDEEIDLLSPKPSKEIEAAQQRILKVVQWLSEINILQTKKIPAVTQKPPAGIEPLNTMNVYELSWLLQRLQWTNDAVIKELRKHLSLNTFALAGSTFRDMLKPIKAALSLAEAEELQRLVEAVELSSDAEILAAQREIVGVYKQILAKVSRQLVEEGLIESSCQLSDWDRESFFAYLNSELKTKFLAINRLNDAELHTLIQHHDLTTLAQALKICFAVRKRALANLPKATADRIGALMSRSTYLYFPESEAAQRKMLATLQRLVAEGEIELKD